MSEILFERVGFASAIDSQQANIVPQHPADQADWIWGGEWHPERAQLLRFRREIDCPEGLECLVHLSADQRFQFFVNGELVARGPDNSDVEHWSIASYKLVLPAGRHSLTALVWWLPDGDDSSPEKPRAPMAHMTWRGGFLLAVEGEWDARLSTGKADWQVEDLSAAISLSRPQGLGYHDIGPAFCFDLARWADPRSVAATVARQAVGNGNRHGVRLSGWRLHPTSLPEQRSGRWQGGRIRALREGWREDSWEGGDGCGDMREALDALLCGSEPVTVAPRSRLECIWDFETYLCGYPDLEVSGGSGAEIGFEWAESLYVPGTETPTADPEYSTLRKDNRNQVEGRVWIGFGDRWRLDGSAALLPALWWRSGRYVRLRIDTKDKALTLRRLGVRETGYPLEIAARFDCDDEGLNAALPLMEHTLRMNAHETWSDGPYYEQLCYLGDSASGLAPHVVCRDGTLDRRSIEMFDWSRNNDNLIAERYPSRHRQDSGTYALLYPALLDDYLRWRPDPGFARDRLPGQRGLIEQVLTWIRPDGNVGPVPGWPFVDWPMEWDCGCGPGVREGDASLLNLHMLLALGRAASIEDAFGEPILAGRLRQISERVRAATRERFWNSQRGLMADDPEHRHYSEHAQALAILTRIVDGAEAEQCFRAWMADPAELVAASIYFSYYLLEAFYQMGKETAFFERLDFWKALPSQGFVTLPEAPEPARSDCHAWGAHPLYHCYASIAGIRPADYGFASVRIAPMPGPLRRFQLSIPHAAGELGMRWDQEERICEITLPEGLEGEFAWNGQGKSLVCGRNILNL